MNFKHQLLVITSIAAFTFLVGCVEGTDLPLTPDQTSPSNPTNPTTPSVPDHHFAVVNMADPGYADYDLALVDLSKSHLTVNEGGYAGRGSDYAIAAYGKHFYRIGRYGSDTITKYSIQSPKSAIYTYSTNATGSGHSSNPYDLIFVSETKAYMIRYGDNKLWVVNPSASNQSSFKTKEINISAYADSDGVPEMSAGVIVNGKLYVTLQKLDEDWAPSNTSSVLVINTSTDQVEREIPLQTTNPGAIVYHPDAGLFVQSDGDKLCFACLPKKKTGGIEKINLSNNTAEVVVWDTGSYGLNKLAITDANTAYVSKYYGWGDQGVFKLNLATKTLSSSPLDGLNNVEIRNLTYHEGKLWVSIAGFANPRINLYNIPNETPAGQLSTAFYPEQVVFIKQ